MVRTIKEQQTKRRGTRFDELLNRSKRVSKDGFATNFGGIPDDVIEMLNSTPVNQAMQEARDIMESDPANPCLPPLRNVEFGRFSDAPRIRKRRGCRDRRHVYPSDAEVFSWTSDLRWDW